MYHTGMIFCRRTVPIGWFTAAVLLALGFGCLSAPSSQAAELWRCAQKNGGAMFTDRPTAFQPCEPYTGSSPVIQSRSTKKNTVPSRLDFRGVRPAMTESQVLARAGYPNRQDRVSCINGASKRSCSKRWVYNYGNKRVVEVLLENGQVADIKNLPRP